LKNEKKNGESNLWISKPSQGTHGIGHKIVDTLIDAANSAPQLSQNSLEFEKIVQLYVEKPLLVLGKKFDMRCYVFVRSFVPFEAYFHDFFYVRLANKDYDSKKFRDQEISITTISAYSEDPNLSSKDQKRLTKEELKTTLITENPNFDWENFVGSIFKFLSELFSGISTSVGHWPRSSAYYSIDIIFDNSTNQPIPKLEEINFMGDWHAMEMAEPTKFLTWCDDLMTCLATNLSLDETRFHRLKN